MSKTKDEMFMMRAYEEARRRSYDGELDEVVLDKYEVGRQASITPKAVDAICNLLAQANFIKKLGGSEIRLTRNGEALAKQLLQE